jgi:hypothetical protein
MAKPWRPEGWTPNPAETEKFVSSLKYPTLSDGGPKLKVMEDKDVFLYQYLLRVCPNYRRVAQAIGSCVGHAYAGCSDILACTEIAVHGEAEDWHGRTLEASIYAFSRVESRGKKRAGQSDGSYGAAACKAIMHWGLLHYDVDYNGQVFKEYSGIREKQWGDTGVPDDLEPHAKKRRVRETSLVRNFDEYCRAIGAGFPVAICSNVGFTFSRDSEGFCKPRGQWLHAMAGISKRHGKRPGGLIWNSWGNNSNSGPHYPDDMPVPFRGSTFWCDADVLDRMLGQGDSFAISNYDGFPPRKLPDWSGGVL